MMGFQSGQKDLFSYSVDLDKRVPAGHPLRRLHEELDFGFVRERTAQFYGTNGHESVDPAVLMKMMLLLFFDNISSERELVRMLPYRLDYLWFLGYGLDDHVPNHSVLSKARRRWGTDVFEELFARTVAACMQAGLVEGSKIHMDGSLIDAHASSHALIASSPELIGQLRESLGDEMNKLDETLVRSHRSPANSKKLCTTDPDSELVHRNGSTRFRYKTHRAVDDRCGVVTAVETTPGATPENERLMPLVEQHEAHTGEQVCTVVADTQYGTNTNFAACRERGIRSHMADAGLRRNPNLPDTFFSTEHFTYDEADDSFTCPAGERLRLRQERDGACDYRARPSVCRACALRSQCTGSKQGRNIRRHRAQHAIDEAKAESAGADAKSDRVRRKWLMEGSFADAANNHGLKRSRWRRLWRQRIQDLMIAVCQNLRKLIRSAEWSPANAEHAPQLAFGAGKVLPTPEAPVWSCPMHRLHA